MAEGPETGNSNCRGQGKLIDARQWSEFLERHAKTLWSCDFLTVKTWTTKGIVDLFVLFYIHPESRQVILGGISANPDAKWMQQQARNATMLMEERGYPIEYLIRDRDGKFVKEFDAIFAAEDAEVVRTAVRSPNMNAFAERFAQTLRVELLDHFCIFGEKHLRYLINEFLAHYHKHRPHQSLDNKPPDSSEPCTLPFPGSKVVCEERLGGLLKSYSRVAA
jgi:putative transposase